MIPHDDSFQNWCLLYFDLTPGVINPLLGKGNKWNFPGLSPPPASRPLIPSVLWSWSSACSCQRSTRSGALLLPRLWPTSWNAPALQTSSWPKTRQRQQKNGERKSEKESRLYLSCHKPSIFRKGSSRKCLYFLSWLIFPRTISYFPPYQVDRILFLSISEVLIILMMLLSQNLIKAGYGLPVSKCSSSLPPYLCLFWVARLQNCELFP